MVLVLFPGRGKFGKMPRKLLVEKRMRHEEVSTVPVACSPTILLRERLGVPSRSDCLKSCFEI